MKPDSEGRNYGTWAALTVAITAIVSLAILQSAGAQVDPSGPERAPVGVQSQPARISAELNDNRGISGDGFKVGEPITIDVDDPATDQVTPDWTYMVFMEACPGEPGCYAFAIHGIPLEPGYLITASDSVNVKQHEVVNLGPTVIAKDSAMLFGTAPEGVAVVVWLENYDAGQGGAPFRNIIATRTARTASAHTQRTSARPESTIAPRSNGRPIHSIRATTSLCGSLTTTGMPR